jgi:hypothetical protein
MNIFSSERLQTAKVMLAAHQYHANLNESQNKAVILVASHLETPHRCQQYQCIAGGADSCGCVCSGSSQFLNSTDDKYLALLGVVPELHSRKQQHTRLRSR